MSNMRLVRNSMFNANEIRNVDVDVKAVVVYGVVKVPKHTVRLRNTLPLLVTVIPKSSYKGSAIHVRRTPHELHAGQRVHRLPHGSKWHGKGRRSR